MPELTGDRDAAPPGAARGLAVFDLDGTITYVDTLLPYLRLACAAEPSRWLRLWRLPALACAYLATRDRARLKGGVIAAVLGGASRTETDALAAALLDKLSGGGLRPGALAAIEAHRLRGDRLVLLSASTDLYVGAVSRALGFDEWICSEVRWNDGRLDGHLSTPNRRGEEKRAVVAALLARLAPARSAAYGNAASDLAHLVLVDAPLLVNGNASARRQALALGVPCGEWP